MGITINTPAAPQQQLPQLIKQSSTYKLFVPKKVEEKIRYLCRKFPDNEWSGILFYNHVGTFEKGDLEIHCEDFFPMDLGNATFTQFKMDESVANYITENIELFSCDMGLLHSHDRMSTFFSGTDTSTLQSEGNDTNCFVSLIVNNAGTYCAAITRKKQKKIEITTKSLGTSYEFFGEGAIKTDKDPMSETTQVIDKEVIEYFMLDIEVEHVDEPLHYLDIRFDEIEAKKKAAVPQRVYNPVKSDTEIKYTIDKDEKDEEFYQWLHSNKDKEEGKQTPCYHQPSLFTEEVMEEMVDASKWQPDKKIIHYLVCQLLTCSLIVNKDIDLKQWVSVHMKKKYDEIFAGGDGAEFSTWADSYVEFILNHYNDPSIPSEVYDDWDTYQSKIAMAISDELSEYPSNLYINEYWDTLNRYILIDL